MADLVISCYVSGQSAVNRSVREDLRWSHRAAKPEVISAPITEEPSWLAHR